MGRKQMAKTQLNSIKNRFKDRNKSPAESKQKIMRDMGKIFKNLVLIGKIKRVKDLKRGLPNLIKQIQDKAK